jgi:dihydrofolate reductase
MNLIVAADNKWGIGRDGGLLASIPTDMKYFKEHTMGKVVVMGRKTLESMPGRRGLPKRTNYVLTTDPGYEAERCIIVNSEDELWEELSQYDPGDVFLIGGATLYNRFYRMCDKLYVTKLDADLNADTFITCFDDDPDYEVVSESEPVTENGITFRFVVYGRKDDKER